MVLTKVATQGWDDLATLVSRSRRSWVRHRCQEAPGRLALMWWASSRTAARSFASSARCSREQGRGVGRATSVHERRSPQQGPTGEVPRRQPRHGKLPPSVADGI